MLCRVHVKSMKFQAAGFPSFGVAVHQKKGILTKSRKPLIQRSVPRIAVLNAK
jgi:hypothetical protein